MPAPLVQKVAKILRGGLARAEDLWGRAKAIVKKQYKGVVTADTDRFWKLVVGIFKKMTGQTAEDTVKLLRSEGLSKSLVESIIKECFMIDELIDKVLAGEDPLDVLADASLSPPVTDDRRGSKTKPYRWVVMTDTALSGWGQAQGTSYYALAVWDDMEAKVVLDNAKHRSEMKKARITTRLPKLRAGDHLAIVDKKTAKRWYEKGAWI